MSATAEKDLAAAVADARVLKRAPRMPPAELRVRVRTSATLRYLLPRRVALSRAIARGKKRWLDDEQRAQAIESMQAIVAGTPRGGELEELERRKPIEEEAARALFWQPWRTSKIDRRSLAAVERAFSSERPVVISVCHLGPFVHTVSPLTAKGISPITVSGAFFFEKPSADYWGRRTARWRKSCEARGERLVPASGCFPVLKALAELHEPVMIFFDMPGSNQTPFLGKPVMLASGTAQLAHQTDALVLPLRARRDGLRIWTDVWEPVDARDHDSPEGLHKAIAAVHERSILEIPEQWEDPMRPGAWEASAGADEWGDPAAG